MYFWILYYIYFQYLPVCKKIYWWNKKKIQYPYAMLVGELYIFILLFVNIYLLFVVQTLSTLKD